MRVRTWQTAPPKPENASMLMPRCTSPEWLKLLVSIVTARVCCGGSACTRYVLQKPCSARAP